MNRLQARHPKTAARGVGVPVGLSPSLRPAHGIPQP